MTLLFPVFSSRHQLFSPHNANAFLSTTLPKSFPIPMEGRDDFFCVDPKSLSMEQLNAYKKEMLRLIHIEQTNLDKRRHDFNARIHTYHQGIWLAEETIKSQSADSAKLIDSAFFSHFKSTSNETFGYVDPKALATTQLQLYIEGINEEIDYETKLTDEFKKEATSRIEAYQTGIRQANDELNVRKGK